MQSILERIDKAALKFLTPLTPDETFKTIIDEAMKLVRGNAGAILLNGSEVLTRVYGSSKEMMMIKIRKNGFAYNSFRKKQAIIVNAKESSKAHPEIEYDGVKSVVFIPLSYLSKAIGVLIVRSKTIYFTNKEVDILKLFGSLASMAIRKTQLYDEARKALEVRDRFIDLAAHELRTPLTSLSGYVQLLHSKMSFLNTKEAKWTKELSIQSNKMIILVEELLEINRLNSDRFHLDLKECSLKEILIFAVKQFKTVYPDRRVDIQNHIIEDDHIVGDFSKLLVVTRHLLDNAAKFSSKKDPIIIKLKSQKNYIHLIILDKGKGIAKDDLEKIFEGYYKGKNIHHSGIGLGLYLAKEITKRHKGIIKIHSQQNKGTKVEIKLPRIKS